MGARWRRPFCTSIQRDPESPAEKPSLSPRICSKLGGLFTGAAAGGGGGGSSNPSTPRIVARTAPSTPTLRCRTTVDAAKAAVAADAVSRRLADEAGGEPKRLLQVSSEPSSPRSPSKFALFKASLRFSRSRCGVCAQSVRAGGVGAAAVFTAECAHAFHLPCISAHIVARSSAPLVCPVCSASWIRSPLLHSTPRPAAEAQTKLKQQHRTSEKMNKDRGSKPVPAAKVYNDDEPLLQSSNGRGGMAVRFNPIPEEAADEEEGALGRIFPSSPLGAVDDRSGGIEVSVTPEAALVSVGRTHRNYVVALNVRAPPPTAAAVPLLDPTRRAPVDLVTVLDLTSGGGDNLKRAMRHLISSLGHGDRLSIVAFSAGAAKRLLPLHLMSRQGQRAARQIVDRLIVSDGAAGAGAGDAVKKATKVLEDRRERNPVATIMLLSDDGQQQGKPKYGLAPSPMLSQDEQEADPFTKCVMGGLLSVLFQQVTLHFAFPAGEISAVYACGGGGDRAAALGGGSCIRLGHLHAGEERELLVELRVRGDGHHPLSVRCSYRDAATQELVCGRDQLLPMPPLYSSSTRRSAQQPQFLRSSSSLNVQRLRNLFVATRAVAESRRLSELDDLATAVNLLSSAHSLLQQSSSADKSLVLSLETELADLQSRRRQQRLQQQQNQQQQQALNSPSGQSRAQQLVSSAADEGKEPLTPTSAWRAAERLAKLAIMRKSLNRVGDLHGFESARF